MIFESIQPDSPLANHARTLFHHYGDFLRATQACGTFNFPRFEEETRTLPAFYTDHHGEVLLALEDDLPAACIVYRDTAPGPRDHGQGHGQDHGPSPEQTHDRTCEIKRLFVLPAFRSRGLARQLVAEVLARVTARGYARAILDTDIVNMPGALALYQSFGFREYGTRQGNIAFLERTLSHPREEPLP